MCLHASHRSQKHRAFAHFLPPRSDSRMSSRLFDSSQHQHFAFTSAHLHQRAKSASAHRKTLLTDGVLDS